MPLIVCVSYCLRQQRPLIQESETLSVLIFVPVATQYGFAVLVTIGDSPKFGVIVAKDILLYVTVCFSLVVPRCVHKEKKSSKGSRESSKKSFHVVLS